MSNKLTIYLAGRMGGLTKTEYNTWREVLRKKLEIAAECCNSIIQVINPADYFDFDNMEGHTDKEIMQFDLNMVRQSDIVIANVNGINESIGTSIEVYEANRLNIPIMSCMGTGNKLDPTKFEVTDIYKTSVCPLAKVMRKELKNRGIKKLKVVYSKEEPIRLEINSNNKVPGSISFVPSIAGLIIASEVIKDILKSNI